jgi:hypothetical protein
MSILIAKWEMLNLQMGTSSLGVPQGFDGSSFPFFPLIFIFIFFPCFPSSFLFYFILLIYFFKTNSSILIS